MTSTEKPQTTQRTGKLWKALKLVGILLVLAGIFGVVADLKDDQMEMAFALGIVGIFFGVPTWIVGKFGGWWFHG